MSNNQENGSCSHDCGNCSSNGNCSIQKEPANAQSHIKKVIGVVSGKGGVGKSFVTSVLAVLMNRRGFKTAILDADITGPSIPKAFGIKERATATEDAIIPVTTKTGIEVMSLNLLVEQEDSPVVWRGPIIANTVKQFWQDVIWNDVDFMFVDMPPGTGDVPLTVFQSLPVDGIIMVTSPQQLVGMVVAKAVNMAKLMDINVLGVVENYSYLQCPDCGKQIKLFGESNIEETSKKYGLNVLDKLPLNPEFAALCDKGIIEMIPDNLLNMAADKIEALIK